MTLFRVSLLLLYSLSPGIAKLTGNHSWFILGLFFWAIYLFCGIFDSLSGLDNRKKIEQWFIFFMFYAIFLNVINFIPNTADINAQLISLGNFLIPLVMVYLGWRIGFKSYFWGDLLLVGLVHCLIALLIYYPIYQYLNNFEDIRSSLLNGALPFRLSSVSGSANLSVLMLICFAVSVNVWFSNPPINDYKKILLIFKIILFGICAILSLQRAAILGVLIIFFVIILTRKGRCLIATLVAPIIIIGIVGYASIEMPVDMYDVILSRMSSTVSLGEDSAIVERVDQWFNIIQILGSDPLGSGGGKLGQASRIAELEFKDGAIYDGDPFRIIGEYGVGGVILVAVVLLAVYQSIKVIILTIKRRAILSGTLLASLCLALVIQSFGTNITELYFVNSLFWIIIFLLKDADKKISDQTL